MSELLPCPFCSAKPEIVTRDVEPQGDSWYGSKMETFVLCDCGACLFDGSFHEGFYDAETRAVVAWNRRAARCNDTAPVAPIGDARNATIEECAFVAEHGGIFGVVIAARIRKLKGQ